MFHLILRGTPIVANTISGSPFFQQLCISPHQNCKDKCRPQSAFIEHDCISPRVLPSVHRRCHISARHIIHLQRHLADRRCRSPVRSAVLAQMGLSTAGCVDQCADATRGVTMIVDMNAARNRPEHLMVLLLLFRTLATQPPLLPGRANGLIAIVLFTKIWRAALEATEQMYSCGSV